MFFSILDHSECELPLMVVIPESGDDEGNCEASGVGLHELQEKNSVASQIMRDEMAEYLRLFVICKREIDSESEMKWLFICA